MIRIGFGGKHGYETPAQCPSCKGSGSKVGEVFAVIEKVGGYIGASHARGSAMFNFGAGALEAFLIAASIPYELVTPATWIRPLGLPLRRRAARGKLVTSDGKVPETDHQWKSRLRTKAQQLHPTVKVTLAVADALLLATYCHRHREGKL